MSSHSQVGRSISPLEVYSDRGFRALTAVLAWSVVLLVLWVVVRIGQTSWPAVQKYGLGFLRGPNGTPAARTSGSGRRSPARSTARAWGWSSAHCSGWRSRSS